MATTTRARSSKGAARRRGKPTGQVVGGKALKTLADPDTVEKGFCGARNKRGGTVSEKTGKLVPEYCHKRAGWGTDHAGVGRCKLHGGNTEGGRKQGQDLAALDAVQMYGLPREVDPHVALLEELARTAGHVDFLRAKLNELGVEDLVGLVGSDGVTGEGLTHHPRTERTIWLSLYQDERAHLVSVAAACVKAGVSEAQVRLAEALGSRIATLLDGVLAGLNLTKKQQELAPKLVGQHLALLEGTAVEHA